MTRINIEEAKEKKSLFQNKVGKEPNYKRARTRRKYLWSYLFLILELFYIPVIFHPGTRIRSEVGNYSCNLNKDK